MEVASLIESFLPGSPGEAWYHSYVSPDIHVISRFPIVGTASSDGNGIFEIDTDDGKIIVLNAHLPCCGNDTERQREIDRLLSYLRNSKAGQTSISVPENTPIFIVGDMNLVGLSQQQRSLVTGDIVSEHIFGEDFHPDWDDSAMEDALPISTGTSHAVTWFNSSGSFSAGRLDYMLYTGSVVDLNNSFALNTSKLSISELSTFDLHADDTYTASDHFPCVIDVDLSPESSINVQNNRFRNPVIYPNPTSDILHLEFHGILSATYGFEIRNLDGKMVHRGVLEILEQTAQLPIKNLVPAAYLLNIKTENSKWSMKFVRK